MVSRAGPVSVRHAPTPAASGLARGLMEGWMDRRSFFRVLAGAAALPLVAKLPMPAKRVIERVGAYARLRIEAGAITAITVTSAGAGYHGYMLQDVA
jgi:hypothetical protein